MDNLFAYKASGFTFASDNADATIMEGLVEDCNGPAVMITITLVTATQFGAKSEEMTSEAIPLATFDAAIDPANLDTQGPSSVTRVFLKGFQVAIDELREVLALPAR